jgi:hypothetical protein
MKISQFFLHLGVDKCDQVWYNKGGDQRAADGGQGPNFRSDTPIWNFFATSSGLHMAPNFPEKWTRSVHMVFIFIISYFFIKVKCPIGSRSDLSYAPDLLVNPIGLQLQKNYDII